MGCVCVCVCVCVFVGNLGDARSRELFGSITQEPASDFYTQKTLFFFSIFFFFIIINTLSWSPSIVSLMMEAPPSPPTTSSPVMIHPPPSNDTSISNCTSAAATTITITTTTSSSSSSSSSLLAQDAISNANCKEAVAPAPQSIVVALRIRPLTASEHKQGCKDCIGVIPGEPQVYIICISNPNHM